MKRLALLLSIILAFHVYASAQKKKVVKEKKQETQKSVLTIEQYLDIVKKKLPEFERNRLQVNKAKSRITSAKGPSDFNIEMGFNYERKKEYSYNPSYQNDYGTGLGGYAEVNKTIAATGTRISTGMEYSRVDVDTTIISIPPTPNIPFEETFYEPIVYAEIAQPILKNFFGKLDRFAENDAEMKLAIEKLKKKEMDKRTLNFYTKLYYNWILQKRISILLLGSIASAKKLQNQVWRKFRAGLSDNDDFQKARYAVLKYNEQFNQSETRYKTIENELNIFIDIKNYKPDQNEFEKIYNQVLKYEFITVSFDKTRNKKILKLTVDNLKYAKDVSENKMMPEMNIVGSIKVKSQEDDLSNSFSEMKDIDYSVGFLFKYPLGNNESEGDLLRTKHLLKEIQKEYEIAGNRYKKNFQNIIITIQGNKKVLRLKQTNLASLLSRYKTEKRKYNQARLLLAYLIDTENSIASERIDIILMKKQMIDLYFDYKDITQ